MHYKDPNLLSDSSLIFAKALDLGTFPDTPDVLADFSAYLAKSPNLHVAQTTQDRVKIVLEQMTRRGFLQRNERELKVTQAARDWGVVFRTRPDGTVIMFGSTIDEPAWTTFMAALKTAEQYLSTLKSGLAEVLDYGEHTVPARLDDLDNATAALRGPWPLPVRMMPLECYRQAAVLACREEVFQLRRHKEMLQTRARDRQILKDTEQKIQHLERILAIPGLASALTTSKPRLTDFINVGVIEEASSKRPTDEKFGILTAPGLFSKDYAKAAEGAFSRDRSFAVGFLDIDKFGDFNREHDETIVDQDVLPNFMRALEAYCYGRAIAYRQGGDEYLVLLHNADEHEARIFFESLRPHIAKVRYPDRVKRAPTLSIGVHVIDGNNEVTVFEAQHRANIAKKAAKDAGRDCVRLSTDLAPTPTPQPESPTT